MSMFFCQGCQEYRNSDKTPVHNGEDGQYCDDCWTGRTKEREFEKIQKQIDSNSADIIDLDNRVKQLEKKKK